MDELTQKVKLANKQFYSLISNNYESIDGRRTFILKKWVLNNIQNKKGTFLDIGCGNGRFLIACKYKGFGTYGIEGSVAARSVASKKELFIYTKDFLSQEFKSKKFDVVTLWQVLEHIDDPNRYLSKIKKIIKKDGLLYIGLPNIESTQYLMFRSRWFHLDLPRHMFAYSPRTLKAMLKKNGFDIFYIDYNYLEYNPFGFFQSFFNVILPVFNFVYKIIKRGKKPHTVLTLFSGFVVLLLFLPVVVLSLIFYLIEIIFRKGATFGVYAKIRNV